MGRKKKKRRRKEPKAAELNIMPFIDIFSMLNTFLLVSAAFVNIGILEVQVPFFTSAPPDKSKPTRSLDVKVDVDKEKAQLTTSWSQPPADQQVTSYKLDKAGMTDLHQKILELRQKYSEQDDRLTLFSEDDVKYQALIGVIDAVKTLKETDPKLQTKDKETGAAKPAMFLFEKVVMGSVVL